jgi:hypothetical protein
VAVGWATVDLDRATAAWRERLPAEAPITDAPDSVLLGARCRLTRVQAKALDRPDLDGEVTLLLLEPATEGRLAATLARHGEGWVATWFAAADDEEDAAAGAVSLTAGVDPFVEDDAFSRPMRSAVRAGPLGPERLLLDGPVTGPHRLVVRPATIEP